MCVLVIVQLFEEGWVLIDFQLTVLIEFDDATVVYNNNNNTKM